MLPYILIVVGIPTLCALTAILAQSTVCAWVALPLLMIVGFGLALAITVSLLSRAERRRFFTRRGQREAWSLREPWEG